MIDNSIDWTLVLITTSVRLYLTKTDLINLSLTSKLLRSKIIPKIFDNLVINDQILLRQSEYFMHNQEPKFGNLSYLTNIWVIGKNGFSADLAFKETQIDPFIKIANFQLKSVGSYFKSLSFECLGNVCYFIQPLACEFQNLRTLSFIMCTISLTELNSIFEKLTKLEAVELSYVHLIKSPDSNSTENILFPQSLSSLTYNYNKSDTTNFPLKKPLEFLTNNYKINNRSAHPLLPVHLPNLHKLHYISNAVHEEFLEFL
ncbi:hypothetical protein CONCODRAFT_14097, partial [Conidiobolus coronatus NRRL 28638]